MDRFKITNITVRPPRLDSTGKDLRTAVERVGHPVQFRDDMDRPVILQPGRHYISNKIDGGLLGLQKGGFIKIEKIDDITQALQQHAFQEGRKAKPQAQGRKATAVQMGLDTHTQKSGAEYEGAVNPDGDPNFLAQSTKTKSKKKKGAADDSRGSETVGQS